MGSKGLLKQLERLTGVSVDVFTSTNRTDVNVWARWWWNVDSGWPEEWGIPPSWRRPREMTTTEYEVFRSRQVFPIMEILCKLAGGPREVLRYQLVSVLCYLPSSRFDRWYDNEYGAGPVCVHDILFYSSEYWPANVESIEGVAEG